MPDEMLEPKDSIAALYEVMPQELIDEFEALYISPNINDLEGCSRCGSKIMISGYMRHLQWHKAMTLTNFLNARRFKQILEMLDSFVEAVQDAS